MLHRLSRFALPALCASLAIGCSEDDDPETGTNSLDTELSFFVTSETNPTGDLGGIAGADATCDQLATAVGAGAKTWRAYLSTETEDARDRIGDGPWYNADGTMVAADVAALHALTGDANMFITEAGDPINGQWNMSNGQNGAPINEHDILTGSDPEGNRVPGLTCDSWTSSATATLVEMTSPATGMPAMVCQTGCAKVGHSDGMGPMQDRTPPRSSWNSAHDNAGCNDTAPRGGSGRFYCFATN